MHKKGEKRRPISLKWGMFSIVALCWIVPLVMIVLVAGALLNRSYEQDLRHTIESGTARAMEQVEMRVETAIESSKAVSYNGDIAKAYHTYQRTGDSVQLYSQVTEYLSHGFSRDENLRAVFVTFLDRPNEDYSYVIVKGDSSYHLLRNYRLFAREDALKTAAEMDTGIQFRVLNGELYIIRNLMDLNFKPYAVLVMQCNKETMFQSVNILSDLKTAQVRLDDATVTLLDPPEEQRGETIRKEYTSMVGGHSLYFTAEIQEKKIMEAMPGLRWAIAVILLMVFPLLLLVLVAFYRHVTRPVETLAEASLRVQNGERGYQVQELPRNQEFRQLTQHFNAMSTELENQFERIYEEQQALQEARIRSLQSQINPHFLGNTLEIINWEARMAENEKVSAMIEALATMLDAAISRDGRSQITLREELSYVNAYLYIIQERMGDGLKVRKEIDETLLDQLVPRLLLQPLAENAVEHDLVRNKGGELCIRALRTEHGIRLEVEHGGHMTPEDRQNIDTLLSPDTERSTRRQHVGIRNLHQRLQLIYGDRASLSIEEVRPGRILASIDLPVFGSQGAK